MVVQLEQHETERTSYLYSVDAFEDGLAIGQHASHASLPIWSEFSLRLPGEHHALKLRSRYMLDKDPPLEKLERHLGRLSYQGVLRQTVFILGVNNDPFHPFEGRFDASMRFLSLFERYTPGMLIIQTRSPLLVLSLPVLKRLGKNCQIHFGLETSREDVARRYTPGLPRVEERIKAIRSLSRFGIQVRVQVSPVLPYGDIRDDAGAFAELLVELSQRVDVRGLPSATRENTRNGSSKRSSIHPVAEKLARDGLFQWLGADSTNFLVSELLKRNKQIFDGPTWDHLKDPQLGIFAA